MVAPMLRGRDMILQGTTIMAFKFTRISRIFGISSADRVVSLVIAGMLVAPLPAMAKSPTLTAAQLNSELATGYRVAAGDRVKVTVFDEPTLTGEYLIGVGGSLSMPLISSIAVEGRNIAEIEATIAEKLKVGGYVLLPKVSVEILRHRPFYILGEVNKPGEYPYTGDLTFEQAVATAGGFTPRANRRNISLRRQGWANSQRVRLSDQALKIAPGDTISVRESIF
jgi:polysaccharide biosynthesis/export protein